MKQLKQILSLCLALACMFCAAASAFATDMGDADGDGKVSPADARLVLRFSIGLENIDPLFLPYCDLDNDGYVTPADARLTLRYSIGLFHEDDKPAPKPEDTATPTDTTKPTDDTDKPQGTKPAEPAKSERTKYIENLIQAVKDAEILDNLEIFTKKIGSRWYASDNIDTARGWIRGILKYYKFDEADVIDDGFNCNGTRVYNVYTKIPTAVENPDILLFVAHYDSYYEGKGAVDNASGLCTVLEIARVLKSLRMDFGVEIRFLFTAAEEVGYHGAYRYVNYFSPASLDRHKAVFNVDMSAHFRNSTNHYLTVSTKAAPGSSAPANLPSKAVDEAKQIFGSCGEYAYRSPVAAGLHDLIPFDREKLPTITLSWREINAANSHGSQDDLAAPAQIHTSADVFDNLDLDSLYKTTRLAVGAAAALVYDYVK